MSDKPHLVVSRAVFEPTLNALAEHFEIHANQEDLELNPQQLAMRSANADALFVVAFDTVDTSLLNACPKLKMIATASVGFNHIDVAACKQRGIFISNTPDVITPATADMAWTLLMAAARRVTESERWLREGRWDRWAFDQFLGQDIYGASLGIVGMGRIGSAIAQRARGFDMSVQYYNRTAAPNESQLGAKRVELNALLADSDFVMLVLPYSPSTHHFIGAQQLAMMKPSAVLINIARGGIVDDVALAAALRNKTIFSAGLDVFENEPMVSTHLLGLSNLVMTPHIGSATRSNRENMAMLAAKNLIAWHCGQPLVSPV